MNDVEPFNEKPDNCPKCNGRSQITRYQAAESVRDEHGCFRIFTHQPAEHLVVKCRECGYERLMEAQT